MAIKRIGKLDPLLIESILMLVYGEPGTGKSSLAFTTESPFCLDFDRGLQRTVNRGESAQFDEWGDALEFVEGNDIKEMGIKTIINDTGGTMLDDYVTRHIIKIGGKGIVNPFGGLGLPGYGVMKDQFTRFYMKCKEYKVDMIFICHSAREDDGQVKKFYPKMTGGSYDILMSKSDLIGYMEMAGDKITLDFNPTDRHAGKNCAGFKKIEVPHFEDPKYAGFLGRVISETKKHMNRVSQAQTEAIKVIEDFGERINNADNVLILNALKVESEKLSSMHKKQVENRINRKHAELWAIENIDLDKLKSPEDFKYLSEKLATIPKYVSDELRDGVKKLMDGAEVVYDKEKGFMKKGQVTPTITQPTKTSPSVEPIPSAQVATKANMAVPEAMEKKETKSANKNKDSKETNKTNDIVQTPTSTPRNERSEEWFNDRIGKKIIQKSEKGLEEVTVLDDVKAFHMANAMQKRGYSYFDMNEDPFATAEAKETATA